MNRSTDRLPDGRGWREKLNDPEFWEPFTREVSTLPPLTEEQRERLRLSIGPYIRAANLANVAKVKARAKVSSP